MTGAAGNWQVDPSVLLRSADIDGDGSSELIAVEYMDTTETNQYQATFTVTGTSVTIIRVGDGSFSFSSEQELEILFETWHPLVDPADQPNQARSKDVWTGFVPVRNGTGGQDLLCTTRHQTYDASGNPYSWRIDTWVGVLRWRPVPTGGFPAHLGFVARHMVDVPGWTWSEKADDRLLPARLPGTGQLVVTTPDQARIGILSRAADGRSFSTTFSKPEWIDAIGAAGSWQHKYGDAVIPADLDGDGRQEIVIVSTDGSKIGVLQPDATSSSLNVRWADGHVRPPGVEGGAGWRPTASATYVATDVDGDGCDEIVAITSDGRLGMLRGIPAASASLSKLPSKLGPVGVTLHDVRPKQPGELLAGRREQIASAYAANMVVSADSLERNLPYLDEATYFLHVEFGLRLSAAGFYTAALDWFAAVYDYSLPVSARKIAYLLTAEESAPLSFRRADDWLRDPLNPHAIAATRPNAYTRFTKPQIARCIIAFADTLYTHGTSEALTPASSQSSGTAEALAKAWELYLKALELLSDDDMQGPADACRDVIGTLEVQVGDDRWINVWRDVRDGLSGISSIALLKSTAESLLET
ncbi:MAG TPA: hypothetical protein VM712_16155, partial [Gaiellales bacterium]|nr:hypothetical protein [Gaiellales bacterium]